MREFELLEHIYRANPDLGGRVLVPPGDDMALLQLDGTRLLAAVDQLVGGRHFDPDRLPPALIGRKAVNRSLSDIAAMAGRPVATLVAATLPRRLEEAAALAIFDACRAAAADVDAPLVGGDIAVHAGDAPLVLSVTVLAEPATGRAVTRAGAAVGDGLYVTGALGGSLGADGLGHHVEFRPRIAEAIELARALGARLHAMIDLSDGLGRDAGHLADAAGARIEIDAGSLPRRGGADVRAALADGEDYELCFAAAGEVPDAVLGVPVTRIGAVTGPATRRGDVLVRDGADTYHAGDLGWQHET